MLPRTGTRSKHLIRLTGTALLSSLLPALRLREAGLAQGEKRYDARQEDEHSRDGHPEDDSQAIAEAAAQCHADEHR